MLVKRVLPAARKRLVVAGEDSTVVASASLLSRPHVNLVVVCDRAGAVSGVLSKTDIVRHISHCHGHACTLSVAQVMTRSVVACRIDDWLHDVWSVMKRRGVQCLPVIGADREPLGVLYARDALQALLTEVQNEEELLRDYVMSVGYR